VGRFCKTTRSRGSQARSFAKTTRLQGSQARRLAV